MESKASSDTQCDEMHISDSSEVPKEKTTPNRNKNYDHMINTDYRKLYWEKSLPNIYASLYNQIMTIIRVIILSQYDPTLASAYGFGFAIQSYVQCIALMLSRGINTTVSYYYGQKKNILAEKAFANGVYVCFIASGVNIAIFYPTLKYIIPLLGTPASVEKDTILYCKILLCCSSLPSLAAASNGMLRSQGFPIFVLYSMVIGSTTSVILAYLLCIVAKLGIVGYAISQVSNNFLIGVANMFALQYAKRIDLRFRFYNFNKVIFEVFARGGSSLFNKLAGVAQIIIMNEGIVKLSTSTAEATRLTGARAAVASMTAMIMTIGTTLALNATLPLANFTRGAGMYTRFRQINLYGLKATFFIVFALSALLLVLSPGLPYLFFKNELERKEMEEIIQIFMSGRVFVGPCLSLIEVFQSCGYDTAALILGMNRNLFTISTIFLIIMFTSDNVWMFFGGFPIGDIVSTITSVTIIYIFRNKLYLTKSAAETKERAVMDEKAKLAELNLIVSNK